MQNNKHMSQEEMSAWVREQFQKANKHLAENGVLFDSVVTEESRYLPPYFAMWKIKSSEGQYFWVISGDLPTDFMPFENEKTARLAVKHFSFLWQMKAENIRRGDNLTDTDKQFADLLESRAEGLHRIQAEDGLWDQPATND